MIALYLFLTAGWFLVGSVHADCYSDIQEADGNSDGYLDAFEFFNLRKKSDGYSCPDGEEPVISDSQIDEFLVATCECRKRYTFADPNCCSVTDEDALYRIDSSSEFVLCYLRFATGYDCAVVATPSPTDTPVVPPTESPVEPPIPQPTEEPDAPAAQPVPDSPTDPPTLGATDAPAASASEPTTGNPTPGPIDQVTETPTKSPSKAPTPVPTEEPSPRPVPQPTEEPAAAAEEPTEPLDSTEQCVNAMRMADDDNSQLLTRSEYELFLYYLADCKELDSGAQVSAWYSTSVGYCVRFGDIGCLLFDGGIRASAAYKNPEDRTGDEQVHLALVCGTAYLSLGFLAEGPGGCPVPPTPNPTNSPSRPPTSSPTNLPSKSPTMAPSPAPTPRPVLQPTEEPGAAAQEPTDPPSKPPTSAPSPAPVPQPTEEPGASAVEPTVPLDSTEQCASAIRMGDQDNSQLLTQSEYEIFLYFLADCKELDSGAQVSAWYSTSVGYCVRFGDIACLLFDGGIRAGAAYKNPEDRTGDEQVHLALVCGTAYLSLGFLAEGPGGCPVPPTPNPTNPPSRPPTIAPSPAPVTPAPTRPPTRTPTNAPTSAPSNAPTLTPQPDPELEFCVSAMNEADSSSDFFLTVGEFEVFISVMSSCPVEPLRTSQALVFSDFSCDCSSPDNAASACCAGGITRVSISGAELSFLERDTSQTFILSTMCVLVRRTLPPVGTCFTPAPTNVPTPSPTPTPTLSPTRLPTVPPTASPTVAPSASPTPAPTNAPVTAPVPRETNNPTRAPTDSPTSSPTQTPTSLLQSLQEFLAQCTQDLQQADLDNNGFLNSDEYIGLIRTRSSCPAFNLLSDSQEATYASLSCLCTKLPTTLDTCCLVQQSRRIPLFDIDDDNRDDEQSLDLIRICQETDALGCTGGVATPPPTKLPTMAPTAHPTKVPSAAPVPDSPPLPSVPTAQPPIVDTLPPTTAPTATPMTVTTAAPSAEGLTLKPTIPVTQAPAIPPDEFERCLFALKGADKENDNLLKRDEYLKFVELYSGCEHFSTSLDVLQDHAFLALARYSDVNYQKRTFDEFLYLFLLGNSGIATVGVDKEPEERDEEEKNLLNRICEQTKRTFPDSRSCIAPSETFVLQEEEFSECLGKLVAADANKDNFIVADEYLPFLQSYGNCPQIEFLDFARNITFTTLACEPTLKGGESIFNCQISNLKLNITGASDAGIVNSTSEERKFLERICETGKGLVTEGEGYVQVEVDGELDWVKEEWECEDQYVTPPLTEAEEACTAGLQLADKDNDQILDPNEYRWYLGHQFPNCAVSVVHSFAYILMSCTCLFQPGSNILCCLDGQPTFAGVPIDGAYVPSSKRTDNQNHIIGSLCRTSNATMELTCSNSGVATSAFPDVVERSTSKAFGRFTTPLAMVAFPCLIVWALFS